MPLFNEEELVETSIRRVLAVALPGGLSKELIVVDDGSTDGSAELVEALARELPGLITLVRLPKNRGKGAALRCAIERASGEYTIIQDADLEYDPRDYEQMLEPLLAGEADAVFGSRFASSRARKILFFWHSMANFALTTLCNAVADLNLSDMETCYKAFRTSLIQSIPLRCNRFGFEPEVTIKLAQRGVRIYEVPISYHGRTYEEGKKIGLLDAIRAVGVILRFGLSRDVYRDDGQAILDALSSTPRFNRWMADSIRPYLGKRILEIGAGIGNLSRHLSGGRRHYLATDIDGEHLARLRTRFLGRARFSTLRCDLSAPGDFEPLKGGADTVVCLNVLEHIERDDIGLANLHSALVAGGRAIVLVPQGTAVFGTLDTALGHHRRYSERELRSKMEAAGFVVERILRFNRVTYPAWFVNGRILRRRRFGRFQLFVFDRLVWLLRILDPLLPWPPTSLIAVGRRD